MYDQHSTVVFLGPSLPRDEAQTILAAELRPPVAKGDIYALLATGVQRIVVIDGLIHGGPSVWQRELLAAIDEGIEVLGASGVGALRAAELHPFGMRGFGTVFDWYRGGAIDGDDEVALHHATEDLEYRRLSEPLVNLRASLQRAVADGQITADEEHELVWLAKRTHYPERSMEALLHGPLALGWSEVRRAGVRAYLAAHAVDVQADDARAVLAHCAQHPPVAPRDWIHRADPWSAEFRHVAVQYRRLTCGDATISWSELKAVLRRSRAEWDARIARFTIDWCMADLARQRGVTCPAEVAQSYVARWSRAHDAPDPAAWARRRGLTLREHAEILELGALTAWLRGMGPPTLGIQWDREAGEALAAALPGPERSVRSDDAAFLSGWLEAQGFWYPHGERQRQIAAWGLGTDARRRALAHARGISLAGLRQALDHRVAAMWLIGAGLHAFGRTVDLEVAAVQAFLVLASADELAAVTAELPA